MSIKNRPVQGKLSRIVALLLLTPMMMMLNASQAMTLCVGHDGRVEIELVVEDHCTCEVRTSGADADSVLVGAASCITDENCQSCTDLSIPIGACGGRMAPVTSKAGSGGLTTAPPHPLLPAMIDAMAVAAFESPPDLACYHTPLKSIILRV